jgi:hypothetical protein
VKSHHKLHHRWSSQALIDASGAVFFKGVSKSGNVASLGVARAGFLARAACTASSRLPEIHHLIQPKSHASGKGGIHSSSSPPIIYRLIQVSFIHLSFCSIFPRFYLLCSFVAWPLIPACVDEGCSPATAMEEDPLIPLVHVWNKATSAWHADIVVADRKGDKENHTRPDPDRADVDAEIDRIEAEIRRLSSRLHHLRCAQQQPKRAASVCFQFFISFWEVKKLNDFKNTKLETTFHKFSSFSLFTTIKN